MGKNGDQRRDVLSILPVLPFLPILPKTLVPEDGLEPSTPRL